MKPGFVALGFMAGAAFLAALPAWSSAYAASHREAPLIAFEPAADTTTRPLFLADSYQAQASFSPDGQWIGFATSGGLSKVSLVGGPPITIVEHPDTRGSSWGADGMIVFGSTSGLWRVPADGGTAEQLSEVDVDRGEQYHSVSQLLPGGSGVLSQNSTGSKWG